MIKTRKNKNGGASSEVTSKVIGQGIGGIVYYPALSCDNPNENLSGNYVSKLMSKKGADIEWNITERLREFKPGYAIYPTHRCSHNGKELLFSKYGGEPLLKYYENLEKHSYSKPPKELPNLDEYIKLIKTMKRFIPNLVDLHKNGLWHNDLTFENVLYNHEKNKLYLIDFGRSTDYDQKEKHTDESILIDMINELKGMLNQIYPEMNFSSRKKSSSRGRRRSKSSGRADSLNNNKK